MPEAVNYITNEQGERVGVVLSLALYHRLNASLVTDTECLIGLSIDELNALSHCKLAVTEQGRLSRLLARNAEAQLSNEEVVELEALLAQADQLTVLKTRARYTLQRLNVPTAS